MVLNRLVGAQGSSLPRVEECHFDANKVAHIARYEGEIMLKSSGGDQAINIRQGCSLSMCLRSENRPAVSDSLGDWEQARLKRRY